MDELLKLLEENALSSPADLAQRLNRDPEEVARHIKQLEDDRVILAYKAIVDDDKAGRDVVKAVIEVSLSPERGGGFNRLAARIAKYPAVKSAYLMSGRYDLMLLVEGKNLRDIASFVSEKLSTIQGVLSTATHFVLKPYKELDTLMLEESEEERLKVSP
ncbi:MAG: Lrp/AsnC family transcriptional regulator [Verrucomicrobiota bacterium]